MKHPIGFKPSYPNLILKPDARDRKETEARPVDLVGFITLTDDDRIPYEGQTDEPDKPTPKK